MNIKRNLDRELKLDLYQRLRLIEMIALWEGRLTSKSMMQAFGIKRQQASKDITYYRNLCPENLEYDTKLKGYKTTKYFKAKYTDGSLDEYLKFLSFNKDASSHVSSITQVNTPIELIMPPNRVVEPKIIRALIKACRNKERIDVKYASVKNPLGEERNIIPHTLVTSGYRWHVRAYCEKDKKYKDFVLGRFLGDIETIYEKLNHKVPEDKLWHTFIDLVIVPNPSYTADQQKLFARERGMDGMKQVINIRAPLAQYYLQLMHIPFRDYSADMPHSVILENLDEVKKYLF
ncbi:MULTISPECIES: WYL domain-containing protein [Colwellia]|uniref:WYL domain-containing protein n=1 Tax=Colwellia marinimaniae TaxID=1513592 RepID=A0ABQ0MZW9_9GAMM|nr:MULTISPECIES: WYL domain-containing protein [Colwellia]GAW97900.1 WYL domain-containing protein [Colwellia marinimaniae]